MSNGEMMDAIICTTIEARRILMQEGYYSAEQEYRQLIVHFTLSEMEARWLKALVQNPIVDHESTFNKEMREKLWNALKDIELP